MRCWVRNFSRSLSTSILGFFLFSARLQPCGNSGHCYRADIGAVEGNFQPTVKARVVRVGRIGCSGSFVRRENDVGAPRLDVET
jgi:hypothetical protein